jgi:ribosomal protein S16
MLLTPREIAVATLGVLRPAVLQQAKIELRMNRSLLEMMKGNTPTEALVQLREEWVTPLERLIAELDNLQAGRT